MLDGLRFLFKDIVDGLRIEFVKNKPLALSEDVSWP